ncbi:MAG: hypothetical protein WD512_12135, partial [Candidatus Paceibacterota bacterium]
FLLCCVMHYIAPHAYVYICVPDTLWGFITSPMKASSPECKAIRYVMNAGADGIDYFWILVAISIMSRMRSFMMSLVSPAHIKVT